MRKARLLGAGALILLAMLLMAASAGAAKTAVHVLLPAEPEPGVVTHEPGAPGDSMAQTMAIALNGEESCVARMEETLVNNDAASVTIDGFGAPRDPLRKGCSLGIIDAPSLALSSKGTVKLKGALVAELDGCVYKFGSMAAQPLTEGLETSFTATPKLLPKLSWNLPCPFATSATVLLDEAEVESETLIDNLVRVHVS